MFKIWFSILIGFIVAACSAHAETHIRTKIVGGEEARVSDWPGIAALGLHSKAGATTIYFCGGTMIAPTWVLTAAHCLHDFITSTSSNVRAADGLEYAGDLIVTPGIQNLKNAEEVDHLAVARTIVHPTYLKHLKAVQAIDDTKRREAALAELALHNGYDIALLELTQPWSGPIAKLSLNTNTDPADGARVRVAGFGYTEFTMKSGLSRYSTRAGADIFAGSDRLLQASLGVIPTPDCRKHYDATAIGTQQICAGLENGGRDSCNGDSGGPLVAYERNGRPYQIGLVSWGKQLCGSGKSYGVYTRIAAFADWLRLHVKSISKSSPPLPSDAQPAVLTPLELEEAVGQLSTALAGAADVGLEIQGPRPIYLGNEFSFVVRSPIAGRLMIFDINANREVTLIFPNRFTIGRRLGRIKAGGSVTIPGTGYGFTAFKAQEPTGQGRLLALIVPDGFDIQTTGLTSALQLQIRTKGFAPVNKPTNYFMRFILQIERALLGAKSAGKSAMHQRWGFSAVDYNINR